RSSKEVRARAAAPEVEAGNVYLPHASISGFVNDFIEELSIFPNGAHDDMCDSFSQYINNTRITNVKLPKVPSKIIRVGGGWE
ncbi:MAG: phage terminase large subunit, partial [Acidobacteria bacterium]|nr:phage terminase large subunit [Acidobacteriota bacterium]